MQSSKISLDPEAKTLIRAALKVAEQNNVKLYIVGGYLRDILLGRNKENPDIDFAIKKNAINFGREVARELKAGFVVLDKEHGCSRVVKKAGKKLYTLDFTDFRGKTLEDDLQHRDFTINAFCLEPKELLNAGSLKDSLIDPYNGVRDLKRKVIRLVNKKAFDEDPLRILRAFSLAIIFGFKIDKETLKLAGLKANKLSGVSHERIRDELFKILSQPGACRYLEELDKLKILKVILPEIEVMRRVSQGPYHHLDVWQHSLETVRQFENAILEFKRNEEIRDYLDEIISPARSRRALIKFAALLHDIGKPASLRREEGKIKFHGHERVGTNITKTIAERLKLSNDEIGALIRIVLWHLRPGYLADNDEVTPRAIFRYFRDTKNEALSVLLLSLGDQRATRGRLTTRDSRLRHEKLVARLIKEYFRKNKEKKLIRLINGNDLMNKFKLQPSPLVGKILSELEELQAIGKIKNKAEALREAKKLLHLTAK